MIRKRHRKRFLQQGDCAVVGSRCYYLDDITLLNSNKIGLNNGVGFGEGCWLNGYGGIHIGFRTIIGPRCIIHSANHRRAGRMVKRDEWDPHTVYIGDDCWLGAAVVVLPGTDLGDRCIVGAGSILSGSYPPGSIIHGEKATVQRRV